MVDRNFAFCVRLVRALASLGVAHACITPGSRSTPVALALAEEPGITDWPHHDERSSAFFALGIARATRTPALAVCTSGTAAAEFHPAVLEARHARVPLIVLTADRPAELQGVGANQTVDQRDLYGAAVKWSQDLEPPQEAPAGFAAALAARLVAAAREEPPGPVHLNLRLRAPLVPGERGPVDAVPAPCLELGKLLPDPEAVERLAAMVAGRRGMLVCGPQDDPGLPQAAAAAAKALEWPLVADPLSGCRYGEHDRRRVIDAGDLLAAGGGLERGAPEAVIRVGALPTSKPLWTWLSDHPEVPQVMVDSAGWRDPLGTVALMVRADAAATLAALAAAAPAAAPTTWPARWQQEAATARRAADELLADEPFPNEPAVARLLGQALPAGALLFVASSMPVRDVDTFSAGRAEPLWVAANRGTSGIDGCLSTALGMAAAAGRPSYLLAGDLSALHDLTALATAARLALPLTVVVLHNDGGGIFHFLPQIALPAFERHWGAPHGLDFVRAAEALGVEAARVESRSDLVSALARPPARPRLLEVRTDRRENAALHERLRRAVADALGGSEA